MSPRNELSLTAAESRARDAVRSLARPRGDAPFRERLKRDFVSGQIGAPRTLVLPSRSPLRALWMLVPAAAALAVVIGFANRGPAWRVVGAEGEGMVIVDRRPVPVQHLVGSAAGLAAGSQIETGTAELEVVSTGNLVLQITPGSRVTLPKPPGRWFGRVVRGGLSEGEVRITTGPRFAGARLALETPEAAVEVLGTTLAVIREPVGTCVCVLDGSVAVGPKDGTMKPVASGRRMFIFNDGRSPETADIRPTETVKLGMFRDRHSGVGTR